MRLREFKKLKVGQRIYMYRGDGCGIYGKIKSILPHSEMVEVFPIKGCPLTVWDYKNIRHKN